MRTIQAPVIGGRRRASGRPPSFLLFLAIVWSVALSFRLIGVGLLAVVQGFVKQGWFDEWMTDRSPSQCLEVPAAPDQAVLPQPNARNTAWQMGMGIGMLASMRNAQKLTADSAAKLQGDIGHMAAALGVPAPSLPAVEDPLNAFVEYANYVRGDPQCVAGALAHRYSTRDEAVYRFGAVMGFVVITRSMVPQLDVPCEVELRRYARAADVPKTILDALTADLSALPPETARQQLNASVAAAGQWLAQ